ncbi:MAG: metallophosphoesterase family protein [Chromatiales bacterium]|nr:metallophosphoesterase family protein [Chromatiales bacterium]
MKVAIVSDSHDNIPLLARALADAHAMGAETVLHCGDVVAPSTLAAVTDVGLPIHVIHGNNTGDLVVMSRMAARRDRAITFHGQDAELELGGRRIFLVHYPHYARAMCATGDWDLVCCGHSHVPGIEQLPNLKGGKTTLVDPGTVGGAGGAAATWVFGDLEALSFEVRSVPSG